MNDVINNVVKNLIDFNKYAFYGHSISIYEIPNIASKIILSIKNITDNKYKTELKILDHALKEVKSVPNTDEIEKKITDLKTKLLILGKEIPNYEELKQIVINEVSAAKKNLEESKGLKENTYISKLTLIINILMIPYQIYLQIGDNNRKLELVTKEIKWEEKPINYYLQQEKMFYKLLETSLNQFQSFIDSKEKHIRSGKDFNYDIESRQLKNKITSLQTLVHNMAKNLAVGSRLMYCVEKLQDGMTTMINLFDLIDKYRGRSELYAYIGHIRSTDVTTIAMSNRELGRAVKRLDQMIKANVVLSQYQRAASIFKQSIFPLAKTYTSQLRLQPADADQGFEIIMYRAVSKLEKLKEEIAESDSTSTEYDKFIHTDVHFRKDDGGSPFYVWRYDTHNESISDLLQGKQISLKADVTESHDNAVKFNMISVKLRASDETVQTRLDEALNDSYFTMIHSGNSYYRCGTKFYTISSERQVLEYSFRKNSNGEPVDSNLVYRKIGENDYMLSPYTVWNIRIFGFEGDAFRKETIDIELEGRGQYAEREVFDDKVCQQDLENYYTIDKSLTQKI